MPIREFEKTFIDNYSNTLIITPDISPIAIRGTDDVYIKFNNNSSIKFNVPFVCDFLIVGGGGGGNIGGGGGGGEVIYKTDIDINEGLYKIFIGNGGIHNENGENTSIKTGDDDVFIQANGGYKGYSDAGDGGANGNSTIKGGIGSTNEVVQLRRMAGGGGGGANSKGGDMTYTRKDNDEYLSLTREINELDYLINVNPITTAISYSQIGDDVYYVFNNVGRYTLIFNDTFNIDIIAVGGGGGGGSGGHFNRLLGAGGGGGGGKVVLKDEMNVQKNTKFFIDIGVGGNGGCAPTNETGNPLSTVNGVCEKNGINVVNGVNGVNGSHTEIFMEKIVKLRTGTNFRTSQPIYTSTIVKETIVKAEGGGGGAGCIQYYLPNNGIKGGGGNVIAVDERYLTLSEIVYANSDLSGLDKIVNFKFDKINQYNNYFGDGNIRLLTNTVLVFSDDNPKNFNQHGSVRIDTTNSLYIDYNSGMNIISSRIAGNNISISFWIKLSPSSMPYNRILYIGYNNCNSTIYAPGRIQIRTNHDLSAIYFDIIPFDVRYLISGGFNTFTFNKPKIYNDTWYFIAWTIDAFGNWKIYLNMELVCNELKTPVPYLNTTNSIILFGRDCNSGIYGITGNIFDFRIYEGIYTYANIQYLYINALILNEVYNNRKYVLGGNGASSGGGNGITRNTENGYRGGGAGGGSGMSSGENGSFDKGGNGGNPFIEQITGTNMRIGGGGGGGAVVLIDDPSNIMRGGVGMESGGNGGSYDNKLTTSINGTDAIGYGGGGGGASGYINKGVARGGNGKNGVVIIRIKGYLSNKRKYIEKLEIKKTALNETYRYLYSNIRSGAGGSAVANNIMGTLANVENIFVGGGGSGGAKSGNLIGDVNINTGGKGRTGTDKGYDGIPNTGGGGGGGGMGGMGGSGLVIIRIKDYRQFYYVNQTFGDNTLFHGGNGGGNIGMDGNGIDNINGKAGTPTMGGEKGNTNDTFSTYVNRDGIQYLGGSGIKNNAGGGGGYFGGGCSGNKYDEESKLIQVGGGGGGSSYINTSFSFNTGNNDIINKHHLTNGSFVVSGNDSDYYYENIGMGGYYNRDGGNGVVVIEYSKLELVGELASGIDRRMENCRSNLFDKYPLNIIDMETANRDIIPEMGGFKNVYTSIFNGEEVSTEITYSSYISTNKDISPLKLFDGSDTYAYFGNGTENRYNSTTNNGDYLEGSRSKYPHTSIPEKGEWIKIKLHKPIIIKKYEIQSKKEFLHRAPGKWSLYGINGIGDAILIHKMETRMTASNRYKDYYANVENTQNLLSCIIYLCDNTYECDTYIFIFTGLSKKYSKNEDYRNGGILSFVNLSIYEAKYSGILTTNRPRKINDDI